MIDKPKITRLKTQKIIGISATNTLANDKTKELWQKVMPRRSEILNRAGTNVYDLKIYPENLQMKDFTSQTEFEKWAAIPVTSFDQIPEGMKSFSIPEGDYAVFIHKGPAHTFPKTIQHIFMNWLPTSGYQLDNRPHFEILTETYSPVDPNAEEEVWIPIKK